MNPHIGGIGAIKEVDDDDVILLAVTMAAADALLDALRVPRQVVIDDHRAKLEIDALRAGLRRDHDLALVAEIVDES